MKFTNCNPFSFQKIPVVIFLSFLCFSCLLQENDDRSLDQMDNKIVIDLNRLTYTIANEHDQFYTFIGVRSLAMVHLAIHDIFNATDPRYESYSYHDEAPEANPVVAAAEATRIILTAVYPTRTDTINLTCGRWIQSVKESLEKKSGLALGKKVARQLIALRANDGHEKQGDYTPMTKPGDYRHTPGFDWVWKPDFSVARPFTLDSIHQFRSPEPPSLSSTVYTKSYDEVKEYGVKNSVVRSIDQTHFAHWWAEFGEHSWNRIGRITAKEHNLSIHETARMFALINVNLYDLYLVSFDSKYHYDTWRPYTAIREGDQDGNPATIGDKNWEPEMLTPPWPEYPSAHAAVGASGAEIISEVFGTPDISFTMESVTAHPNAPMRHYDNLDQAADDCADSRIMNGFHFRFATEEGKIQGRKVARHTLDSILRPVRGQ